MPQFVFQLQGVLHHRQNLERQQQVAVARQQAMVSEMEGRLRAMDAEAQAATRHLKEHHLVGTLDISFLTAHRRYMLGMQRKGLSLAQEIGMAQRELEIARGKLLEAVRARKALQKLRERHHERWLAEQNRREAFAADEVSTQMSYSLLSEARVEESADERG